MEKAIKYLSIGLFGAFLLIGFAFAQTDTSTVDTSVSSSTQVDISPNAFSFTNVQVGTFASSSKSAEIENIGSSNVTRLSIDVGTALQYSQGSGTTADAGAYVLASTDDITYAYLNTEFRTDETMPIYVVNSANTAGKGRFKFTEYEYFWQVTTGNVTGGGATNSCGNGTLRYFNTTANVHNRTQQGGSDLTTLTGVPLTLNAPATDINGWGFADVTFNMPDNDPYGFNTSYCFAISQDCQNAVLFKYNNNVGLGASSMAYDNASLCTKDVYLINDSTAGGDFKPGEMQRIYFNIAIPFGVGNGSLLQSTMTVRAMD